MNIINVSTCTFLSRSCTFGSLTAMVGRRRSRKKEKKNKRKKEREKEKQRCILDGFSMLNETNKPNKERRRKKREKEREDKSKTRKKRLFKYDRLYAVLFFT
ncbi:protein PXR1-like isoform X2 [Bombus pyrosoma]|uniref:protein PXR1-like isoform X2 n=1 Tax=Bombus pyrosoma TaxID=396416 RepID=UPI001CB96C34|nr:protein PXR1-like isoform X2 [Bombus pyrosoma]